MQAKVLEITNSTLNELKGISDSQALEQLRVRVLGKKGELTSILRGMGQVDPEMRPKVGQWVNEARATIENAIQEAQSAIAKKEKEV